MSPQIQAPLETNDNGEAGTVQSATPNPCAPEHDVGRENYLIIFLRQGLTRRQIAHATVRSENTVKAQLRSLYAKLDAASVEEALEKARSFGL